MKLEKGKKYSVIVENQLTYGTFIKEINTIFGKRYLFNIEINTRMNDGNIWEHSQIYKVKEKNIL